MNEPRRLLVLVLTVLGCVLACGGGQEPVPGGSAETPTSVIEPPPSVPPAVAAQSTPGPIEQDVSAVAQAPSQVAEVSPLLTIVYTNNIDGEIEPCG